MAAEQRIGLRFGGTMKADELRKGQIVVVDGHVVETALDPDDRDRVRIVIDRFLAGVDGDHRHVVMSVPRDMRIATARPFEGDPAPPNAAP